MPDKTLNELREKIERYRRLMQRHDDPALQSALSDIIRLAREKLDLLRHKS
jgi:hypothetical protein